MRGADGLPATDTVCPRSPEFGNEDQEIGEGNELWSEAAHIIGVWEVLELESDIFGESIPIYPHAQVAASRGAGVVSYS